MTFNLHTIVTYKRTSASVSLSPTRKSFPSRIFSTRSRESKRPYTAFSYAGWVLANPVLYTPSKIHGSMDQWINHCWGKILYCQHWLFIYSYTHSLIPSISPLKVSGYKSIAAFSGGRRSLNAEFKMRIISDDSLFTIVFCFLSHNTGTVNLWVLIY